MPHVVSRESGPFEQKDLSRKCQGGSDGLQFATTESRVLPVQVGQRGHAEYHQHAAQKNFRRRPTLFAPGNPGGNPQAITLCQKRGGGSRRVSHAIDLKQNADTAEQAQTQTLFEFKASQLSQ